MTDRVGTASGSNRRLAGHEPGGPLTAKEKLNTAARLVLERSLASLEASGDLTLSTSRSGVANALALALDDADLLQVTGQIVIALELIAHRWQPAGDNLAEAAFHGVQLGGIVQSGELDDVADYLRVVEAQHRRGSPESLETYRALARRLEAAYREVMPAPA